MRTHRFRGFTLVEALLTVTIVGILGALALPSFNDMRDKYRLKAAAEALYGDLQYGRSMAIRSNSTLHVSLTSSCWGLNTSTACDCATANSCQAKQVPVSSFPGVTMETSAATTSFDGTRGLAGGGAIAVTFTSTLGKQARVSLSALGRTVLCSPSASIPDYPTC